MPSELATTVLPLIRTNSDLHRWGAANAHGAQMHEGVDILVEAFETGQIFAFERNRACAEAATG